MQGDVGVLPEESLSGPIPECAVNYTAPGCAEYTYPDNRALQDLEANCEAKPYLIACNVWRACQAGEMPPHRTGNGNICDPFNMLASTCQDWKQEYNVGCAVFTRMCHLPEVVIVEQCYAGIMALPATLPVQVAFYFFPYFPSFLTLKFILGVSYCN